MSEAVTQPETPANSEANATPSEELFNRYVGQSESEKITGHNRAQTSWDNEELVLDSISVGQEAAGSADLTVDEFLDALRSFDARFIAAVGERVGQVREHWSRPEIFIDLDALEKDQTDRATWLERALGSTAREYEWDQVGAAVQEIEAMTAR